MPHLTYLYVVVYIYLLSYLFCRRVSKLIALQDLRGFCGLAWEPTHRVLNGESSDIQHKTSHFLTDTSLLPPWPACPQEASWQQNEVTSGFMQVFWLQEAESIQTNLHQGGKLLQSYGGIAWNSRAGGGIWFHEGLRQGSENPQQPRQSLCLSLSVCLSLSFSCICVSVCVCV